MPIFISWVKEKDLNALYTSTAHAIFFINMSYFPTEIISCPNNFYEDNT
jgi:hypothetical protein